MINRISTVFSAAFLVALFTSPVLPTARAAGGGGGGGDPSVDNMRPSPPAAKPPANARSSHRGKKATDKQSLFDDPAFAKSYREAYATIYERHEYAGAIEQLRALGQDDFANVANLIGYSYRKLGDYRASQVWYERALKSDPNHVLTWNYYGLWQIEQGNRDQAQYHLSRIAAICGTDCEEYRTLATALEQPPGTTLVY